MKVVVVKDAKAMGKAAAKEIVNQVVIKPDSVLGLATGGTAEFIYPFVVETFKKGKVDFSAVRTINLDEYKGLDGKHEQSYRYFMDSNLFNHINIKKAKTFVPKGIGKDEENLEEFNKMLDKYPRDLQLLGVGPNGHIAFNEPDDFLNAKASLIKLNDKTIKANARYFNSENDVPKYAFSMGMNGIFNAKKIVLAASGKSKADAIKELLTNDKITTKCPITFLKLHTNVVVIIDEEIAKICKYKV